MFNHTSKVFQFITGYAAFALTILPGADFIINKFGLSQTYFSYVLIPIAAAFPVGLLYVFLKGRQSSEKSESTDTKPTTIKKSYLSFLNVGAIVVLLSLFVYYFQSDRRSEDLLNVKLPLIIEAFEHNELTRVYREVKILLTDHPENEVLKMYLEKVTEQVDIFSEPDQLPVYLRLVNDSTETWEFIGKTPLKGIRIPSALLQIKLIKDSIAYTDITNAYVLKNGVNNFILPASKTTPPNHILFLGNNKSLSFPGIDHLPNRRIEAFSISKYEVSNKEYAEFVNQGGYSNAAYWDFPVTVKGTILTFDETVKKFTDQLGKPGPAGWTYGAFPQGQEDLPVTGISWYEARAYAKFRNLELPNIYQWATAATLSQAINFVPHSNFSKGGLVPVINEESKNSFGLNNIAGNVREWASNALDKEKTKRANLGGNYTDDPYLFNDYYGQNAMDRSMGNGIRLAKTLGGDNTYNASEDAIGIAVRDFEKEPDITNEVFEIFKSQFDIKPELPAVILKDIGVFDGTIKVQRYEMDAPYGKNEKLIGYIFFDQTIKSKLNPIIFFPGSNAIHLTNTDLMIKRIISNNTYLFKEGYALIHPIYKSTYEREDEQKSDYADETDFYKEHVLMWGKDYRQSINYIASRSDMNINNLSYYGISWGGSMANILLAIDSRVKAAVLNVAGLEFQKSKKEIEPHYYTRRITIPVLMVNGKYDQFFPLETSQIPMFRLLGTPQEHKKHYIYEAGHNVPHEELVKLHLDWLHKYCPTTK